MHDIIFISNGTDAQEKSYAEFKKMFLLAKKASTYEEAKRKSFTKLFWLVWPDLKISDDFKFDYFVPEWDYQYIHVFKNGNMYDGICLSSKIANASEKEFSHRFFVNKKEVDIQASTPKPYDVFYINTYEDYLKSATESVTDMFWVVYDNLIVDPTFKFDYQVLSHNKHITHVFKNGEYYDGICLFSKNKLVSKKEFENRFFVDKKEVDIQASTPKPYDIFYINSYSEYLKSATESVSAMFWVVYNDVIVNPNFKFDYQVLSHNTHITHLFKNGEYYDGICLFSKNKLVSKREFENRFFIDKKEVDIQASVPRPFDIVFISYKEPNAEENWESLKTLYPRALRIHGVKGIHQAHIEAAKLAKTDMFWVVDGDAIIDSNFKFDFDYIPFYDTYGRSILHKIVHVWRSKNPINNLEYGYGGVKLLPRILTINMDVTKPDMTTSISTEFKSMPSISNITAFNTDPFSTWRSAFRECVKLSSKTIQGQVDAETEDRLNAWCTLNESVAYGFYAYSGALAGKTYGEKNASDKEALGKINDFNWLQDQWSLEKSQLSL